MSVKLNIFPFLLSIAAFIVAGMTVTSTIDKYISFAGEANAMGFFIAATFLGLLSLVASFEKLKK
tara:strand:- start:3567 stop:3761 length:195 start_codon:yes stop_codon:yes gene_type:complete